MGERVRTAEESQKTNSRQDIQVLPAFWREREMDQRQLLLLFSEGMASS